jgi:hypothetical protein
VRGAAEDHAVHSAVEAQVDRAGDVQVPAAVHKPRKEVYQVAHRLALRKQE